MNFYASDKYLNVIAKVYFGGKETSIENVRCEDKVLRCLIVGGKRVIVNAPFLDYHEPLPPSAELKTTREISYVKNVVHRIVPVEELKSDDFSNLSFAPYIDWSLFDSLEDYEAYLKKRANRSGHSDERRKRRLAKHFGALEFKLRDDNPDVIALAAKWKGRQLIETGLANYFENEKNIEYFHELRRQGLLVASTLRADGRLLSLALGFIHENTWSGWVITHDPAPEVKKYSVGRLLLYWLITESQKAGHRQFDFSIGDAPYKWTFATHARVVAPVGVPPYSQRAFKSGTRTIRRILAAHPETLERLRGVYNKIKVRMNRM